MCESCWAEHGSPQIDTPAVRGAVPLMEAVYDHSCVGGNLHIVLDDFNVSDEDLAFCRARIERGGAPEPNEPEWYRKEKNEQPDSAEQLAAELACVNALQALSVEERASAIALWDGFWGENRRDPLPVSTSVFYVQREE